MKHYLLLYDFVPDHLQRRGPFREAHLAHARASKAQGDLLLAGALAEPADMGVLWFQGEGPEAAEAFAAADPYVIAGLVTRWRVRPWLTVVGDLAATPL